MLPCSRAEPERRRHGAEKRALTGRRAAALPLDDRPSIPEEAASAAIRGSRGKPLDPAARAA
jgi:hypothetical protein